MTDEMGPIGYPVDSTCLVTCRLQCRFIRRPIAGSVRFPSKDGEGRPVGLDFSSQYYHQRTIPRCTGDNAGPVPTMPKIEKANDFSYAKSARYEKIA